MKSEVTKKAEEFSNTPEAIGFIKPKACVEVGENTAKWLIREARIWCAEIGNDIETGEPMDAERGQLSQAYDLLAHLEEFFKIKN